MSHIPDRPIAIFDSGVGGLTVVAALARLLPNEAIVYLGDTARLPYGTKSPQVVCHYAARCAAFLLEHGPKLLLVACNTASAHALAALRASLPVPVLGVIGPGASQAARRSPNGRIGVIATEGTIDSGSYQRALAQLAPGASVYPAACPLLVPLAEEGLTEHPATELLARDYLAPLLAAQIDSLVLGCTHYPLLQPLLQRLVGTGVHIIDSASAVAVAVAAQLTETGQLASRRRTADAFYATDVGARLQRVGSLFMGQQLPPVTWVDLKGH